ncbi:hypothetical protein ACR3K2_02320 [Cryptosporidium serpentis]
MINVRKLRDLRNNEANNNIENIENEKIGFSQVIVAKKPSTSEFMCDAIDLQCFCNFSSVTNSLFLRNANFSGHNFIHMPPIPIQKTMQEQRRPKNEFPNNKMHMLKAAITIADFHIDSPLIASFKKHLHSVISFQYLNEKFKV